ncbi:MAG: TIGR03617 family F420-dependent LLM class oxidoreductase [Actinobacteria bacterium]|nr:TIGR03617 family F420-dependent LLM class oxidoreductase [Actinomycetota bacterium]
MKVDLMCMRPDLGGIAALAKEAEELGYAALLAAETGQEPFMPLALAAEHTSRLQLGTCVAVALSRSPVHLAHAGHDLQRFSEGRFILGVGSQVRGHIEKRFSATFSQPTERMKDVIGAIRAIWRSWNEGLPLNYEGPFYRHTLMTPFFSPDPNPYGPPPIYLAASGAEMTAVGGEVADGLMLHALTSVATMDAITLPALERGLKASGRSRADVELYAPIFVITGDTGKELQTADRAVRLQLAFYASTPAYRKVLAFHGRPDLPAALNDLSKQGRWRDMGALIDDEILDLFSVTGKPEEIGPAILARFGGVLDRVALYAPYQQDPESWARVLPGFTSD